MWSITRKPWYGSISTGNSLAIILSWFITLSSSQRKGNNVFPKSSAWGKLMFVSSTFGLDALGSVALKSTNSVANLAIQELRCVYKHGLYQYGTRVLARRLHTIESVTKEIDGRSDVKIIDHCTSLFVRNHWARYASNASAGHGKRLRGLTGRGAFARLEFSCREWSHVLVYRLNGYYKYKYAGCTERYAQKMRSSGKSARRSIQGQVSAHQPFGITIEAAIPEMIIESLVWSLQERVHYVLPIRFGLMSPSSAFEWKSTRWQWRNNVWCLQISLTEELIFQSRNRIGSCWSIFQLTYSSRSGIETGNDNDEDYAAETVSFAW